MNYDLVLVGGANFKYYPHSLESVSNIINIINNENHKNLNILIVFYDLGLKDEQLLDLKNKFDKVIFKKFNFDIYPEHVSLEKYHDINCTYAWKPIIFHEVCEEYKNCVYWFDTGSFYGDFRDIISILKEYHIYSPVSSGTIEKWTHPITLKYMDVDNTYLNYQPRAGGIIGINYNIEWCKSLVTEWKNLALIKECICPESSDRTNHRQDQAVLTILYYNYHKKYNFRIIDNYLHMQPHYYNFF